VVKDVPDFALVAGAPARFIRWVGRAGEALAPTADGRWRCPRTGALYLLTGTALREETS
jgi:UDP-2-acetamido-3-amino-2,3-dideoxy-glucuronate N-acetyltransferase